MITFEEAFENMFHEVAGNPRLADPEELASMLGTIGKCLTEVLTSNEQASLAMDTVIACIDTAANYLAVYVDEADYEEQVEDLQEQVEDLETKIEDAGTYLEAIDTLLSEAQSKLTEAEDVFRY